MSEPSLLSPRPAHAAASVRPGTGARPLPPLARLERRGALDLALALLAGAQYIYLHYAPATILRPAQLLNHPSFVMSLILLTLGTWGLLAAGALVPLVRHARPSAPAGGSSARGNAELPPGSALWLAAYGLMALVWLALLFNVYPEAFWGFWHLVRFNRDEVDLFIVILPLALAPGWRRLARAIRLAWLRHRHEFGRRRVALLLRHLAWILPLALYAWLLNDRYVMDDGWGLLGFARMRGVPDPIGWREVGINLLTRQFSRMLAPLGFNPLVAIGLLNFLATLGAFGFICWLLWLLDLSRAQRRAGWWLALSSLGVTQMLLGHIEVYPLVNLSLVATMVLGVAALAGACSPGWMALAFALGLAGHLSLIFILPAVLLTLWFWSRPIQSAMRPLAARKPQSEIASNPQSAIRNPQLLRAAAHLFGWGALVHLSLWGALMLTLPDPTPRGLVRVILGSLNTGADKETFIGSTAPTLWGQFATLFAPDNLFKLVQIHFFLAAGPLLVLLLAPWARRLGGWRAVGAGDPRRRRQVAVLGLAWLGYAGYAFAWRADYAWTADWDLFSGVAPLLVLLAIAWLMPARRAWRLPPALLRQVCLFALALSASQHYYHHSRAGFLTFTGAPAWLRGINGRLIQLYEVEHGWRRGWDYVVENGVVRPTPISGAPTESKP